MDPLAELGEDQRQIWAWLDRNGAVSPSQLLAQTEFPPSEIWDILKRLAELGLVVIRDDPDSPDGRLVIPTGLGPVKSQTKTG